MSTIVLTGASGFVGSAVFEALGAHDLKIIGRGDCRLVEEDCFLRSDMSACTDYGEFLEEADYVVHCAAKVHLLDDHCVDPLSKFREVNTVGTINLARQAAAAGVKRFIFISSVKVNGELTQQGKPFTSSDEPSPIDPYGISKYEAEQGLHRISKETEMEFVIIRPPLVYGRGVKANFATMMRVAEKNFPLPFGTINNRRSLVHLDNLVNLIITCIDHPKAGNQTFLVSDGCDVSTKKMMTELTRAAGKEPCLFSVPSKLLTIALSIIGKKAIADRLCGNLQVDISHTKETLGWLPPVSFEQGIARCFEKTDK